MNEYSTPKASPDTFDGDAISRADREFLASLSNHPLVRHPHPRRGPSTTGAPRSTKERGRSKRAFRPPSIGCW
jgi:hypothetical protein